jgi:hypothetical protein
MKTPDKSFTYRGNKYRRKVTNHISCNNCAFLNREGFPSCVVIPQTTSCVKNNNSDGKWSIWVEVIKKEKK